MICLQNPKTILSTILALCHVTLHVTGNSIPNDAKLRASPKFPLISL
jgi:hypothetical protein